MFQILRTCVRILTSTRVAVGVMAILAFLSLLGATIPQDRDLEAYTRAYGDFWGSVIWTLELKDVFHSRYYVVLLVLLSVMVFACSMRRLPQRIRTARRKDFISDPNVLQQMLSAATLTVDVDDEEAQLHIVDICRKRLYRVYRGIKDGLPVLLASKMAFSRYGSFILHLSFIFLLAGGLIMTRFGSRGYRTPAIGEDFTLQISSTHNVRISVEDFNIELDDGGEVSDYVCDVAIIDGGEVISRHRIRPNHPLRYKGSEIYLVSFDQDEDRPEGFIVSVYDSAGRLAIPHLFVGLGQPAYVEDLKALVHASDEGVPRVRLDFDEGGIETHIIRAHLTDEADAPSGYQFVLIHSVPSLFVTLEVVKEPGQWLILTGLVLLTLGTFVSLYLSHRRIWFIVRPLPGQRAEVILGGRANRNPDGFLTEFEFIRRTLEELA